MNFIRGLGRSLLNSIIITMLFALVSISLFVGNFPPTVAQVKQVFNEYKKMMVLKQTVMDQFAGKDAAELADALQSEKLKQQRRLGEARNKAAQPHPAELVDDEARNASFGAQAKPQALAGVNPGTQAVAGVPQAQIAPQKAELTQEMRDQLYNLRSEIFRLSQRVQELENHKLEAQRAALPQTGQRPQPARMPAKAR